MRIAISSCLCGCNVRYDGSNKFNPELFELIKDHELVPICPEQEAGFSVPHEALEISDGLVFTASGKDVSAQLESGCRCCLEKVKGCDFLILKQKSPSCGKGKIYDGSFSGKLIKGDGVFAKLCLKEGLRVYSEEEIDAIIKEL